MSLPLPFTKHFAELTVLRAALLTRRVISAVTEISKHDATPVTMADFGAQALIMAALHELFPLDGYVGEEDAETLRKDEALAKTVFELVREIGDEFAKHEAEMLDLLDLAGRGTPGPKGRYWVMDPVDGTATFLKGQQYAISLALVEDGKEVLSVVCYPNLSLDDGVVAETRVDTSGCGVMLSTIRGEGTDYRKLSTEYHLGPSRKLDRFLTTPTSLADLRLVDCLASKSSRLDIAEALAKQLGGLPFPGIDLWSSHVRYGALMLGEGEEGKHIMIRVPVGARGDPSRAYVWDHAGSQLLYTEMGGKVTDLEGKDIDFGAGRTLAANWGLVAAPESVHGEILRLVRELIAKDSKQ
ncbi:inositol monophosphatase family domain-containing protein [Trichoderma breve]|uniref:Inositol monophosphatase family domain-containing protein n=1 Tax=Trichoderma breve TaxID=2034170 RepID=A0A9W9BJU0_9HYPO|nr:inositol monophosphatase family domain-containing protein [Trichoderma breve]KAJ4861061.1 inositol monophosphatase family domain-containing protein [Trichoderma breve]